MATTVDFWQARPSVFGRLVNSPPTTNFWMVCGLCNIISYHSLITHFKSLLDVTYLICSNLEIFQERAEKNIQEQKGQIPQKQKYIRLVISGCRFLKVRQFQNEFIKSSFLPKYKKKIVCILGETLTS